MAVVPAVLRPLFWLLIFAAFALFERPAAAAEEVEEAPAEAELDAPLVAAGVVAALI